ncbi:DNA-binding LacI/PurR family transcriptional regulator [Allocatelliglobosispora scoriae]|uniref:DNA-binding LacI/PurR family transcriptional regulator n=1 Tax=Allocatelliglobosispora scoriae TaxID=643052 RepID=A0A841BK84_9ACTN|nr:LacI family DNA-binding transcriptional regulator [Allocatelliglobosispora scoriae]MBB5867413.1 DNA-binding LacI/PurR family transcriptional regulator [Allocatelliglobosispora scoriae]
MDTASSPRTPTLEDVAERAGVSRSVASRAINNVGNVSDTKRAAVHRAVRELGYVPNPSARALATNRVGAVVLAVATDEPGIFADAFFAQVIYGISVALERTDVTLTLVLAGRPEGAAKLRQIVRSRRADGIMLMNLHGDDPLAKLAEQTTMPVVFGGRPLGAEPQWYVDTDNRSGARLATEHLVEAGYRRIATITGQLSLDVAEARYRGYRDAMAVAELPAHRVEHADFSEAGGAAAMARLLEAHPDLDAVFAASDNMAAGALRTLRAWGRAVPDEVGVVGFDDLPTALHTDPQLTTVRQPIEALGAEMARMLLSILDGVRPTPLILPARLVVRGSTRPAADR